MRNKDLIGKIAWWMDEAFRIPGTKIRVGWDAILGLIPGVGEVVTLLAQCGLVFYSVLKYPIPGLVAARMIVNVVIDALFGSLPFVGDIFDIFFKANTRNAKLFEEVRLHYEAGTAISTRRHAAYLIFVGLVLIGIIVGVLTLSFLVFRAIFDLLHKVSVSFQA
jgi:hypothetical protein